MSLRARLRRYVPKDQVMRAVWRACVRWPRLADWYYCFDGSFRREHRGVLLGKLLHHNDLHDSTAAGARYTLRRNTHRLEKGLIMRPRRDVFARDYIGQTVAIYARLREELDCQTDPLMRWSHDVLHDYFAAVKADPAIDRHREVFARASAPEEQGGQPKLVPYRRATESLRVDIAGMEELAWRRRSVRWFFDEPVPRELLDRAVEVAKLSPSACNRQPFEFRIFDEPTLAKKIGEIPMGTKGFSQNFPCTIVIVGDLRAYASERDRHVIYVDAGLAAMALQFALEAQGVSSCCINWPDIEQRERMMDAELDLQPNQRPVMCMAVGYADTTGQVPFSQKKTLNEIRSYNRVC